jgi:hypothetical protein
MGRVGGAVREGRSSELPPLAKPYPPKENLQI